MWYVIMYDWGNEQYSKHHILTEEQYYSLTIPHHLSCVFDNLSVARDYVAGYRV
jgi:hypothetical protein